MEILEPHPFLDQMLKASRVFVTIFPTKFSNNLPQTPLVLNPEAATFVSDQTRVDELELEELLERMNEDQISFYIRRIGKGKAVGKSRPKYIKYVDYQ